MNALANFGRALGELIWPSRCAACDALSAPSQAFCAPCSAHTLDFDPLSACPRCGDLQSPTLCARCCANCPPFSSFSAAFLYGGAVREAIRRCKFLRDPASLKSLVPAALHRWNRPPLVHAIVVPVPLSRLRLRERGFNQAEIIARGLARALATPLQARALLRAEHSQPASGLGPDERLLALKNAFRVDRRAVIRGAEVLLVDDVVTTSATAREAAQTLLHAGARSVHLLALARGGTAGPDARQGRHSARAQLPGMSLM